MMILVYLAIVVLSMLFIGHGDIGAIIGGTLGLIYVVFALACFIPCLAVGVRRLHDKDMSDWWLLIALIPFAAFVLLYFFVTEGMAGTNKFGPNPKAPDAETIKTF